MGVVYALYSKTRNTMYYADKMNHDKFWSKYIRNKYPNDEWLMLKDCEAEYSDILDKAENIKEFKEIDLLDPDDLEGWSLFREIQQAEKDK